MAINRDRTAYQKTTQDFVNAIAQVFFNGDEDAAWERWFKEAEEDALITGTEVRPDSPAIILSRSSPKDKNKVIS